MDLDNDIVSKEHPKPMSISTVYGDEKEIASRVCVIDACVNFSRAIEEAWLKLQKPEKVTKVDLSFVMEDGNTCDITVVKKIEDEVL
ncbi:hypothetical protein KPN8_138 [Klebsiella phage KPN8]|nr:hypothetical protein KPN8_138 [Klebsiella phage KPN8]